jgi:dTDP-4-dehydrorhamnose reductase
MVNSSPILIAGRNGRLARDLAEQAARLGFTARAVGRPELDIENVDAIARVMAAERPCAIVNAAAVRLVDEAERNPERALALNRDGAARLAAAAAHAGIPFLHISTDFMFDGSKRTPHVEEDPAAPANIYGRSKLAGEQAVLAAHPSALVLRTA